LYDAVNCARRTRKSSLASWSAGSPNSVFPAYAAVVLAATSAVITVQAAAKPSAARAVTLARPAASARTTPFESTLTRSGVVVDQVKLVARRVLLASNALAKSWSSKPTGSAGSLRLRPEKLMRAVPPGTAMLSVPRPITPLADVARTTTEPPVTARAMPVVASTAAMVVSSLAQMKVVAAARLAESNAVALSCTVPPTMADAGLTTTDATGPGGTTGP
jgi:hypothetical protein